MLTPAWLVLLRGLLRLAVGRDPRCMPPKCTTSFLSGFHRLDVSRYSTCSSAQLSLDTPACASRAAYAAWPRLAAGHDNTKAYHKLLSYTALALCKPVLHLFAQICAGLWLAPPRGPGPRLAATPGLPTPLRNKRYSSCWAGGYCYVRKACQHRFADNCWFIHRFERSFGMYSRELTLSHNCTGN